MPDSLPKPVYLERLKVENIRSFESVDIKFALPESGGQWIVFLGDNGSGKSTLLQLIGLAEAFEKANPFGWDERWANGLVRFGFETGEVQATWQIYAGGFSDQRKLFSAKDGRLAEARGSGSMRSRLDGTAQEEDILIPFLSGFGTNRADREYDEGAKTGYDLVASLYDSPSMPSRGPIDPEKWLLQERVKTFEWSERGDLFLTILDAVRRVLPRVEEVIVSGDGLALKFEPADEHDLDAGIVIPFRSISEGYRATIIWLIDLLAGWLNIQTEENIKQWASEGKLLEAMTGIVLVDELDLHLHPTWQREMVPTLRRLFPNLTFIVTTHSPLIVQSAQDCEVFVVERPSASSPSTVRKLELGASTVDKVLTSSAFGLETQLDPATSAKIAHARDLLAQGETPDVQSLTDRLDEASGLVDQQVEALSQLPWAEARELIRARIEAKKRG